MTTYHLAQLNIAHLKYALDAPAISEFVENIERINQLADQSPGFVWRLQTEQDDPVSRELFGESTLVNMSVWQNIESLKNYVYRTDHSHFIGRRKEWFERINDAYSVLWWVPENQSPTLQEAQLKLKQLQQSGPTPEAFNFKNPFPSPD